jgi:hypothetical protein
MSEAGIAGYELWDTESHNLLDDFDTEAEAFEAVFELIDLNGAGCAAAMALTRVHVDGHMVTLAMGADLAVRARVARSERGQLPV